MRNDYTTKLETPRLRPKSHDQLPRAAAMTRPCSILFAEIRSIPIYGLLKFYFQTRMHSSRMRTARSSGRPGGSPPGTPPWERHLPSEQAPLGADPPEQTPPGTRHPPGSRPPLNRMTNRCKNITLPRTSFAGGNYPLW